MYVCVCVLYKVKMLCKVFSSSYFVKSKKKNGTHYNEFDDFAWNYWGNRDNASFTCYSIPYLTLSLYSVCQLLFIIASIVPLLFFFCCFASYAVSGWLFFSLFFCVHTLKSFFMWRMANIATKRNWTVEWNRKIGIEKNHTQQKISK